MDISGSIPFVKMHGSGNDFVVIRTPQPALENIDLAEFTRRVCRRAMSIGADGVILISDSDTADFHWRYINADGTDGDMCGNGAMVGARFAVDHNIAASNCTFETASGPVQAEVNGNKVTLNFIDAQWVASNLTFDALPGISFDRLMIGVPHVVGFMDDVDSVIDLDGIGRSIRQDDQLQPAGANVNIVHRMNENTIRMRTYERGVEAETLACGTGAVSSAITAVRRGLVQQPVTVRVSSGMDLTVTWQGEADLFTNIKLGGTASVVARGEITREALSVCY